MQERELERDPEREQEQERERELEREREREQELEQEQERGRLMTNHEAACNCGQCLMRERNELWAKVERLEMALLTALPYVEDAIESPVFKRGVVRRAVRNIRAVLGHEPTTDKEVGDE